MDLSRALGQFFTPPQVVDLCFGLLGWLQPALPSGRLLDLSCGEGAFLQGALRVGFAHEAVYGLDADPRLPEIWLAAGWPGGRPHLATADGLWGAGENLFDVVVGNPPFGGGVETGANGHLAQQYHWWRLGRRSRPDLPRELWFLERSLRLLKPAGLLAMVLPEGFFANRRWRAQREALLALYQIEMIVGLPRNVFLASHASVKTAVLLVRNQAPQAGRRVRLAELASEELAEAAPRLIAAWEDPPAPAGRPWEHRPGLSTRRARSKPPRA